ncbi:MAG: Holliday junction resolvase RuvX [Candidatus Woesebacteria bacterium]|nr:Holliday junction resolvase RuvX [Candidatus Woesebacteria bacterium]
MKKILGIDYGRSKIGFAIAEGSLAAPMGVVKYTDIKTLEEKLTKVIDDNNIEKIVVGISEGEMGKESKEFSLSLGKILAIPVETFDETLSTQDAQIRSREAGIGQKKRHEMEDAYAAAIMLQNYLDFKLD